MSRPRTSSRRRSRELALQVLFAVDLGRGRGPVQDEFERVSQNFEMPEAAKAFAAELVIQVSERGEALDRVIAERARNWKVSRMATVDRNVLRLAAYELQHTDTPPAVVLNEAVELAKRFGGEFSPGFVNGVLDAVARESRRADG